MTATTKGTCEVVRRTVPALAAVAAAVVLVGCGSSTTSSSAAGTSSAAAGTSSSTTQGQTTAAAAASPKVGVLSPFPRNDFSITQASIEGVQDALKALPGSSMKIVDNVAPAQQVSALRDLAQTSTIVVLTSGSLVTAADTVAPQYPHVWFILENGTTARFHANVTSVLPQAGEAVIVTGAVAANHSSTKKLGMVTGLQLTGEVEEIAGLTQGAKLIAPSATVTATFTGDYNDIGKAEQATKAQIANGVDGINGDLGLGFTGFYKAVQGTKVAVYNYQTFTSLGCDQSPNLIGGVLANFRVITHSAVQAAAAGKLQAGAIFITLKSPQALQYSFCPGRGTSSDRKVAQTTTAGLLSGKIKPDPKALTPNPGYAVQYQ